MVTSLEWPPFAIDWVFKSGTLAAARALSRARVDGVLPAEPPVGRAFPRSYPRIRHRRARTVLSGLATSSCPLRRRQAVQGAEPSVSFRPGPSAWPRCTVCTSCSSADSPFDESAFRGSPCFGIGHNLSLICQLTSEDIKQHFTTTAALVGRGVAAITVDAGEDLRVALLV